MLLAPGQPVEVAFPGLPLGGKRLKKRFGRVAQATLGHPRGPLPDKFLSPRDHFAALGFLNHPAVSRGRFLGSHQVALLNRLEDEGPAMLLFLRDTTDLGFHGHATLAAGAAQVGNGGGRQTPEGGP